MGRTLWEVNGRQEKQIPDIIVRYRSKELEEYRGTFSVNIIDLEDARANYLRGYKCFGDIIESNNGYRNGTGNIVSIRSRDVIKRLRECKDRERERLLKEIIFGDKDLGIKIEFSNSIMDESSEVYIGNYNNKMVYYNYRNYSWREEDELEKKESDELEKRDELEKLMVKLNMLGSSKLVLFNNKLYGNKDALKRVGNKYRSTLYPNERVNPVDLEYILDMRAVRLKSIKDKSLNVRYLDGVIWSDCEARMGYVSIMKSNAVYRSNLSIACCNTLKLYEISDSTLELGKINCVCELSGLRYSEFKCDRINNLTLTEDMVGSSLEASDDGEYAWYEFCSIIHSKVKIGSSGTVRVLGNIEDSIIKLGDVDTFILADGKIENVIIHIKKCDDIRMNKNVTFKNVTVYIDKGNEHCIYVLKTLSGVRIIEKDSEDLENV